MDLKFKLISIGDADKFIMPIILIIGFVSAKNYSVILLIKLTLCFRYCLYGPIVYL